MPPIDPNAPVAVAVFQFEHEATPLLVQLHDAGIHTWVEGVHTSTMFAGIGGQAFVEVLVRQRDVQRARRIIEQNQPASTNPDAPSAFRLFLLLAAGLFGLALIGQLIGWLLG